MSIGRDADGRRGGWRRSTATTTSAAQPACWTNAGTWMLATRWWRVPVHQQADHQRGRDERASPAIAEHEAQHDGQRAAAPSTMHQERERAPAAGSSRRGSATTGTAPRRRRTAGDGWRQIDPRAGRCRLRERWSGGPPERTPLRMTVAGGDIIPATIERFPQAEEGRARSCDRGPAIRRMSPARWCRWRSSCSPRPCRSPGRSCWPGSSAASRWRSGATHPCAGMSPIADLLAKTILRLHRLESLDDVLSRG